MTLPKVHANLVAGDLSVVDGVGKINADRTGGQPGILLVHAYYCGHCRNFMPTYEELARYLRPGHFAVVALESADLPRDFSMALNVEGYPSLYFFDQSGKVITQYNDNRDIRSILKKACNVLHHCVAYH